LEFETVSVSGAVASRQQVAKFSCRNKTYDSTHIQACISVVKPGAADRSFARLAAARKCLRPFNSTQLSMPPFGRLGNTSPGFAAAISFELEALKIGF
jgi:hypothetical protein